MTKLKYHTVYNLICIIANRTSIKENSESFSKILCRCTDGISLRVRDHLLHSSHWKKSV